VALPEHASHYAGLDGPRRPRPGLRRSGLSLRAAQPGRTRFAHGILPRGGAPKRHVSDILRTGRPSNQHCCVSGRLRGLRSRCHHGLPLGRPADSALSTGRSLTAFVHDVDAQLLGVHKPIASRGHRGRLPVYVAARYRRGRAALPRVPPARPVLCFFPG